MSNYSQLTNFTAKDALTTGDPAKIVKGADVDAELSAISTAIASKLNTTDFFTTGTKLPFYQSAAPTGWTAQAITDYVLAAVVSGTTGGTTSADSWTITGLTSAAHTHTYTGTTALANGGATQLYGSVSTGVVPDHTHNYSGTTASTAATITADGTWRPKRAYVVICSKN